MFFVKRMKKMLLVWMGLVNLNISYFRVCYCSAFLLFNYSIL
jgi:hypothetical protein